MTAKLRSIVFKHPFIALFILCATCTIFDQRNGNQVTLPASLLLLVLQIILVVLSSMYVIKHTKIKHGIAFSAILILFCTYIDYNFSVSANRVQYAIIAGLLFVFTLLYIYNLNNPIATSQLIFIIFVFGFLMRLYFVLANSISSYQHDFGGTNGHFSNIEFYYNNGLTKLPTVVTDRVHQSYHPPFYYVIAAFWMKIQVFIGSLLTNIDSSELFLTAKENLQLLTLFFSSASMVISFKIFRLLGIKENGLIIATALVAFHPTFTILAVSANNDSLSVMLFLASILCALQWYNNPTIANIFKTALAIGLGMMTKLSVALVAPAVAVLFITKFFQSKKYKEYLIQFLAFGITVFPLGLWWGIRNLIKSGVPITYVPLISTNGHPQYVGGYSVWQRLFDFRYKDVWMARGERFGYTHHEYSLGLMILKTSLFGEYYIGKSATWSTILANILFYANVIICVVALGALIYFVVKRTKVISAPIRAFFAVLYMTIMLSYIKFSFDYPHDCTMDFRYIVPTVIIGAVFLGLAQNVAKKANSKNSKIFNTVISVSTMLFCICAFTIYTAIMPK